MKLIVGLGNPGAEYAETRHNFGWTVLDDFASERELGWNHKTKFNADIAEFVKDNQKIMLIKPTTFYNLTGESIRKIKDFYNIENSDILAIHDEMALPVGTIRTRVGGRDAGNNGIKSLIQHIGPDFARIRIGSGTKPAENGNTMPNVNHKNHVLSRPSQIEYDLLSGLKSEIGHLIDNFINDNLEQTTINKNL